MRAFLLTLFLAAVARGQIASIEDATAFDYHRKVGIPEATRIKSLEEETIRSANRIVGGSVTDISQVPYQAGLVISLVGGATSVCGGSLISNIRVVTAAHCHSDGNMMAQSFTVVLGSSFIFSGGVRIWTNNIAVHPNWSPWTAANDIAVLRINAVSMSNVIQIINLPSGPELFNNYAGWTGLASGFGLTSDGGSIGSNQQVSWVNLQILPDSDCIRVYGPLYHNTNICTSGAGGRGTCGGDSGGPLTVTSSGRRILVGVTSYGHIAGCSSGNPAVYARVTEYVNWLASQ